ncbi:MAG: polysaccharide deacetylase family protein [Chitinophagaceae bacterium]
MILIYTQKDSNRLRYSLDFIFEEICGVEYTVTHSRDEFSSFNGARINYSLEFFPGSIFIPQAELLFETSIKEQDLHEGSMDGIQIIFESREIPGQETGEFFPFDIFAATFYLISRYEEYLPHEKDMYGRYAHTNSFAYRKDCLHLPLVNIWIMEFAKRLQEKFPSLILKFPAFSFIPTYDIDIAYAYRGKGLVRNAGGLVKSALQGKGAAIKNGVQSILLKKQDPFDVYAELDELHQRYGLQPFYFFLVAAKNGLYDKNILPTRKNLVKLIKTTSEKYIIGLHPSWQSGDAEHLLAEEKALLGKVSGKEITNSRQHYIRFDLPDGYRQLLDAGITSDYSMGYGSINGFRASVATPYYWFDIKKDEVTNLKIFPFCYMEANSFYEQKYSAEQAYEEMVHFYNTCKSINGTLIIIWHNHMLGTDKMFAGWKEVYFNFLKFIDGEK